LTGLAGALTGAAFLTGLAGTTFLTGLGLAALTAGFPARDEADT